MNLFRVLYFGNRANELPHAQAAFAHDAGGLCGLKSIFRHLACGPARLQAIGTSELGTSLKPLPTLGTLRRFALDSAEVGLGNYNLSMIGEISHLPPAAADQHSRLFYPIGRQYIHFRKLSHQVISCRIKIPHLILMAHCNRPPMTLKYRNSRHATSP
jgi:hypothetical protein